MTRKLVLCGAIAALLALAGPAGAQAPSKARFEWFDYAGNDSIFAKPLAKNEYQNPILAGFHPDPSVVRVGKDFYLVNSTFGFFPGIPVFHSRDLVNWTQIGNAIHRPGQLPYKNVALAQQGVYAATIEYRNGIFYVINTCVECGGNFVVTATNPAGPWSDPIWLDKLEGIDPSIFFDDDGRTYIVHHRNPSPQKYPAHTGLWVMEVDPKTFQPISEDVMVVDGADKQPWHTEYIEGPHLYKVNGTYYLSAAGGGTGYTHGQLLYRSDKVFGPFVPFKGNPVLTQVGLPDTRKDPVTATGHADLFDDGAGNWWAVFLATRVYDLDKQGQQDPGNFHTGRETFMLPVTWKDGWPIVLEKGKPVPYRVKAPDLPAGPPAPRPMTGNFKERETFTSATLAPHWLFARAPRTTWWTTGTSGLELTPRSDRLGDFGNPSFIGRRLAHMKATFETKVTFAPRSAGDEAGLMGVQTDESYYAFGVGVSETGERLVKVRKRSGKDQAVRGETLAKQSLPGAADAPVYLRINVDKSKINFEYSLDGKRYVRLLDNADSKPLSTAGAGGFVGAVVGMYAETGKN